MSGLQLFDAFKEAEAEARKEDRRVIGNTILDWCIKGAVILALMIAMIIACLGCATDPAPVEMCKRCKARPVEIMYKPHGEQARVGLCVPCAHWMGGRIRRKAVR